MENRKIIIKKIAFFILVVFFFVLGFTLYASRVSAQAEIPLIVGPARQEVFVDPGDSEIVEVRFYNQSELPLNGIVRAADFVVLDKDGGPRIIDDPALASPKYSGSAWINMPFDQITIAPGGKVAVPISISVPANAKPGGRYVAVFFEVGGQIPDSSQKAGLGVASRIASLLSIRVNGDITENAIVTRFFAPSVIEFGPVSVETEIFNRGDYHITPQGVITMSNMFGGLVDQVSLEKRNIFPDNSIVYENQIGNKWHLGRYKLSLSGSYGEQGKVLDAITYVWIIPWRLIAVAILTIIIIWALVSRLVHSQEKHVEKLEEELEKEEDEIEKLKKILKKKNP